MKNCYNCANLRKTEESDTEDPNLWCYEDNFHGIVSQAAQEAISEETTCPDWNDSAEKCECE